MTLDDIDGCRVLVRPFDAAATIESDANANRDGAWTTLENVHVHELPHLQCLLAGEDPRASSEPTRTRYNPFTRTDQLTLADVTLETWRTFVGGVWRSQSEIARMAEEGELQGYGAFVFIVPDAFVEALASANTNSLAPRWAEAVAADDVQDLARALESLVLAAREAGESRKHVFIVELQ